ncbi:unnamed protein product [Rotaria magnacalcarata]|uniref:Uncharacterized protein n=2 Tax=Rotaria magnacalcarata TaxID=392030 RepID=A0A815HAY9_9BILA|nr:unnamed protein product [Rotaria magnacalcarata]CAF1671739.1 unnamed protein product [Rotaria magnacalcarata]CAF2144170.1 unnamed protein product [Rotaria magnacalcarata]CAF2152271.1 unnamed protein product [Rotaria magnacalcarata]CAF2268444.1 unnamed protein product [Rotaria magnacalcarata]
MTSTLDSSEHSNHIDDNDQNIISSSMVSSDVVNSDEKIEEPLTVSESEQTDIATENTIDELPETNQMQTSNMITAEASFSEATSADLPLGTQRSSIARILVKPGQIFRVQVDNEVKEVHGK